MQLETLKLIHLIEPRLRSIRNSPALNGLNATVREMTRHMRPDELTSYEIGDIDEEVQEMDRFKACIEDLQCYIGCLISLDYSMDYYAKDIVCDLS